ncbi:MAG: hypothetical protein A2521_06255 [Deltaproteobacteria bacterium RIFOXYD12_FULL_57_12]|nr:MAG: hypothetical protein A2521_06255 [Deltaproteobacteria bacterium RIFOXYD12_FULL_57_12]
MAELPAFIPDVTGVILAGGRSRRFGANKALADLAGRPLIAHVAAVLRGLFASCLVVTDKPTAYAFLGLPTTGDLYPGNGPLAGIHAALRCISTPYAFVTACDMPGLNPELLRFFCTLSANADWQAVLPGLTTGPEPLFGLYRQEAADPIEQHLRAGQYRAALALDDLRVRWVSETELLAVVPSFSVFTNVNRPEDLATIKHGPAPLSAIRREDGK